MRGDTIVLLGEFDVDKEIIMNEKLKRIEPEEFAALEEIPENTKLHWDFD